MNIYCACFPLIFMDNTCQCHIMLSFFYRGWGILHNQVQRGEAGPSAQGLGSGFRAGSFSVVHGHWGYWPRLKKKPNKIKSMCECGWRKREELHSQYTWLYHTTSVMERPSCWSRAAWGAGVGIEVDGASSHSAPHTAFVAIAGAPPGRRSHPHWTDVTAGTPEYDGCPCVCAERCCWRRLTCHDSHPPATRWRSGCRSL